MIEIVNPGFLSLVVDSGRYGHGRIGVPASAALDSYAYHAVNRILGNPGSAPALEVMGKGFSFTAPESIGCAITGARVRAHVGSDLVKPWARFMVSAGGKLVVTGVSEGLRYYVGFSGTMALEPVMGSYTTNLECGFGGFRGRPLMSGDVVEFEEVRMPSGQGEGLVIPSMNPPHLLRVVEGPEMDRFSEGSVEKVFSQGPSSGFRVSARLNRTGIRLEGEPFAFREEADRSIVSEGLLPGTIQVPGDGQPIIVLHERTIGGYVRAGIVARADRDLLAHLKPGDRVVLKLIGIDEAEGLWEKRRMMRGIPEEPP